MAAGERLQALVIAGQPSLNTARGIAPGTQFSVRWIDCDDVHSPNDDLRQRIQTKGAALFARGEGLWMDGREACWLTCTSGGDAKLARVWVYRPAAGEGSDKEEVGSASMTLIAQPNQHSTMRYPDNITVTPWVMPSSPRMAPGQSSHRRAPRWLELCVCEE